MAVDIDAMVLAAGLLLLQAGLAWAVSALLAWMVLAWYSEKVRGFLT